MAFHDDGRPAAGAADRNRRIGRAWLAFCLAIAVHVADEAATGFLAVYIPTVEALRETLPWLPLRAFSFDVWIAGLVVGLVALLAMTVFLTRGVRGMRPVARVLAILMVANAILHTLGTVLGRTVASVHFPRPMPGFYSSPLLLAASIYLLVQLRSRESPSLPPRNSGWGG